MRSKLLCRLRLRQVGPRDTVCADELRIRVHAESIDRACKRLLKRAGDLRQTSLLGEIAAMHQEVDEANATFVAERQVHEAAWREIEHETTTVLTELEELLSL